MKNMSRFLIFTLTITLAYSLSSCGDCKCPQINEQDGSALNAPIRSGGGNSDMAAMQHLMSGMQEQVKELSELQSTTFNIPEGQKPEELSLFSGDDNVNVDAFVLGIFNSLLNAESTENMLDMEFSMSDAPVEDDLFIFAIKPNEELKNIENLTFQMFNEKGFELVAHNQIGITSGNNYKAINVSGLDNGVYIFKLSDNTGRELVRRVRIGVEEEIQ